MMQENNCLYSFFSLIRGSWRNAVYMECRVCPYEKQNCGGYLLTTDTEGAPLLLPVSYFEKITGEKVEKAECAALISREAFESLFNRWLVWNISDSKSCCLLQLIPKTDNRS